jgi:uncharacterized protein
MPAETSFESIQSFLAQKRIAMVGVSRDPQDFSVMLFQEFCRRGYEVIPVNPKAAIILARPCFARVQDIQPPVAAALLMTAAEATEAVVKDCAEAGINRVWMYSARGNGAVNRDAVLFCEEHGIEVVAGECPFMFFPQNGFHKLHGWVRKISGSWPKRQSA